MRITTFCFVLSMGVLVSCHFGRSSSVEAPTEGRVPVTITHVKIGDLSEMTELNATSRFLLKSSVKSLTNGYLEEVKVGLGQQISKGDRLFVIRSKEAQSLGSSLNKLDTAFRFDGKIVVNSPGNGYILQLAYREGDYVQDGEVLATIGDGKSLVFMLELPYELRPYLPSNKTVRLMLPDGTELYGMVTAAMPTMDAQSQTQGFIIRINQSKPIPENLVAKVWFVKTQKNRVAIVPKEAILTNEVQSQFWVMLMSDNTTAVKVPIIKGIESGDSVEVVSPIFDPEQKILLTGNYGLPDTAKVVIEK